MNFRCARIAAILLFQTDLDKSWNYLWYWYVGASVPPLTLSQRAGRQGPRNAPPFRRPWSPHWRCCWRPDSLTRRKRILKCTPRLEDNVLLHAQSRTVMLDYAGNWTSRHLRHTSAICAFYGGDKKHNCVKCSARSAVFLMPEKRAGQRQEA